MVEDVAQETVGGMNCGFFCCHVLCLSPSGQDARRHPGHIHVVTTVCIWMLSRLGSYDGAGAAVNIFSVAHRLLEGHVPDFAEEQLVRYILPDSPTTLVYLPFVQ
jgi:hypothetical protein